MERVPDPPDTAIAPPPKMSSEPRQAAPSGRDLDFTEAARVIWRSKWLVALVVVLCIGAGVRFVVTFSPKYIARMIVSPLGEGLSDSGGLGAIRTAGGPISALLGGQRESPNFENLTVLISTKTVARILQEKHGILQYFFPGSWDSETKSWIRPVGDFFEFKESVKEYIGYPTWSAPTEEAIASYISENILIKPIPDTEIKEIVLEHDDRVFAKNFLTWVVSEADNIIRRGKIRGVTSNIEYLENQLARTTVAAHRTALTRMMVDQQETAMLLHSGTAFSFTLLEPVTVSDTPTRPPVSKVGMLSVAGGFVIGCMLALLIHGLRAAFRN